MNPSILPRLAHAIRFLSIDAIVRATEGHQGVPLGMAEIATALYARHLRFNPADPTWPDRDRVVLSNGHGSMLLYSLLYLTGYQHITLEQVRSFREFGSHCAGHPEYAPALGIEVTTGPLGQGIANALGMAVAEAYLNARFGDAIVNHRTYAFVGDGCLQEGIGQEMISLAGHLRLSKLTLLWDDNQITDDGATELSISENVAERFRVAGWHVVEVDGHDIEAVSRALDAARGADRPSMIACRTVIGRGIPRVQGQRGGHSARLYDDDAQAARELLQWPHGPFEIPDEILSSWRGFGQRNDVEHAAWQQRVQSLPAEQRQEFECVMRGELPHGWQDVLLEFKRHAHEPAQAKGGILISAAINQLLAEVVPERMVGCADLEAPTAHKGSLQAFTASNRSGAYVHCGVREHVMGAMANGMAAHGGVIPLAVTYLAFSDYQRAAMRMAALMGLPVKFVFSHDSIGIGKNGPTHQPVEILAALRAMPNMLVMRPADASEAVECWEVAMQHQGGPVSMVFARQTLAPVRQRFELANLSARGAYVLEEAHCGPRQVTLLATGSEVAIACAARQQLEQRGIATAVVSLPCWELFDQQEPAYREAVLGSGTVRVGVEAALRFGWDQYLGARGGFVGMKGFGAPGPADVLFLHFQITAEAVVAEATRLLASSPG
ncbi:transketolase [Herbaspirillum rubrisubalbicans Os34]|uniref:Transketolase n=1 Tax=Herbaspirillum rubrisubalbicans Os34 TaxID=1235827 RepID=A0A6M3ZKM5_9BURK|nr:transketolase [Herbaspirillum rubrisubalbicans]QJP99183.1 transketolase [Herbaspirillum rubrisubalbicans Os34]